jgi:aminoglycoside/choline kinase family phosphotransferase
MSQRTPAATLPRDALSHTPNTPLPWADRQREAAFGHWLERVAAQHALDVASLRAASADASFRRYLRIDVQTAGAAVKSRIIMDAPPEQEDNAAFVHVAAVMAAAGMNAPQVLDWDATHGFMLLSDLGQQTMMEAIDPLNAGANQGLYLQAVDSLVAWQLASRPGVLPPCTDALLQREMALFPDWYVQQHRAVTLDKTMHVTLENAFSLIAAHNLRAPSVYVHCDFMPRNLIIPTFDQDLSPTPKPSLGVLDFQDALYGPITYDIASLMRDAFLSWDEDFVLDITIRYWEKARKAGLPVGDDFGEFYRGVEWMGLQRHLRILGVFARLTLRDGKPRYLADAPRFIGYIRATAARYRELKPLLRLVDQIEGIQERSGFAYGRM